MIDAGLFQDIVAVNFPPQGEFLYIRDTEPAGVDRWRLFTINPITEVLHQGIEFPTSVAMANRILQPGVGVYYENGSDDAALHDYIEVAATSPGTGVFDFGLGLLGDHIIAGQTSSDYVRSPTPALDSTTTFGSTDYRTEDITLDPPGSVLFFLQVRDPDNELVLRKMNSDFSFASGEVELGLYSVSSSSVQARAVFVNQEANRVYVMFSDVGLNVTTLDAYTFDLVRSASDDFAINQHILSGFAMLGGSCIFNPDAFQVDLRVVNNAGAVLEEWPPPPPPFENLFLTISAGTYQWLRGARPVVIDDAIEYDAGPPSLVRLTGSGFAAPASVYFNGDLASNVNVVDANTIECERPTGTQDYIVVKTPTAQGAYTDFSV